MESYNTSSEAITALKKQGYTEDFNLMENCLMCKAKMIKMYPDEFKIDKFFRFEDDSSDPSIVYAISSDKYDLKGSLVNAYGIYSDSITDEIVKKLEIPRAA